jgi:hypothetical protein
MRANRANLLCLLVHRKTQEEKMTAAELYEVIKLTVPELFGVLKDLVVMTASATGMYVAIKGLSTWKRQIKGQSEYSLAKETLINVYKLRDEIIHVRNPFMSVQELPEPPEEKAKHMTHDEIRFYGLSDAYQKRWDKVISAKSMLSVNLTESEATWGMELKDLAEKLFREERYLILRISHYLRVMNPKVDEKAKAIYKKEMDVIHNAIFDTLDEDDEYNKKLNGTIKAIEQYLRIKMGA